MCFSERRNITYNEPIFLNVICCKELTNSSLCSHKFHPCHADDFLWNSLIFFFALEFCLYFTISHLTFSFAFVRERVSTCHQSLRRDKFEGVR
jgi:hypothetical protein